MRLIIYTGKGGTGKTVSSCSTAIKLAERNHRTLLISSDPAHTLTDAFETEEINFESKEVFPNLHALQIDPLIEITSQYSRTLSYMSSILSSKGIDETLSYEIAMLPGMTQVFSLLKVEEIMQSRTFDVVVLDMPASGEALRYLYLPKLVGSIGKKLAGLAGMLNSFARIFQTVSRNPIHNVGVPFGEDEFFKRLETLSYIMKDDEITSLRLVANPDTFSIENAKRALMSASLYGINVDLVIINKVMPITKSGAYYSNWSTSQQAKVDEAKLNFYPLPVRVVNLHESELKGIEMLKLNANSLFGNDDPLKIFHHGRTFLVRHTDSSLRIILKVPFTEKEDFDIERYGDRLTIKVKNPTGNLVNIVPLPVATVSMRLAQAKLDGDELNVLFEKR